MEISVVICTHNRPEDLRRAIASLMAQSIPASDYEVIVIDNAPSNDDAKLVVDSYGDVPNLQYVLEPEVGLSKARNTGWQKATAPYVAFLDDDATAAPDWLECFLDAFKSVRRKIGMAGGKVMPEWGGERPTWLSDHLTPYLSLVDWSDERVLLKDWRYIAGVNMAIPRAHLERFGGFNEALGRKGTNLLSNEETLLRDQMRQEGLSILYDPSIRVWHHIEPARMKKRWFKRRFLWQGISEAVHERQQKSYGTSECTRRTRNALAELIRQPTKIGRLLLPAFSPEHFKDKCDAYRDVGYIMEMLAGAMGRGR